MRRSGIHIMGKLIGLIKPMLHVMILAVIMGVIGFLCSIFITIFGGYAMLNVIGIETGFTTKMLFIGMILFAIARGILRYAEQASNHYIAFKLLAMIRHKVFEALRNLAPAKLEGKDKGNLISIITSDIELLEVFYAHTISPIVIAFITSLIMTLFIGQYHVALGIVAAVAYIVVGIVIPVLASRKGKHEGLAFRNEFGEMNSFFLDSLRGLREILQFGYGDKRIHKMNERTDSLEQRQKQLRSYEGKTKAITDMAILLFSMIMLFGSIFLTIHTGASFAVTLIPTIAMMSSFGPVVALSNLSNNLFHTLASGDRVLNLLEESPVVEEVTNGKTVNFTGIACKDVTFSYEKEVILNQFSMEIPKNKIIGISGKSGSGKSTLLKLFMRFWDVNQGGVLISDEDIKAVNTTCLRDMQSYVTQETYLFNDTIANNISIAKEDATREEIIEAAKKASLHEFVMSLPNQYDSKVGELGDSLSGGEAQRIGVARAFLHDAPLILLDEPTSNLDSLNEGIILKALKDSCKDKTVILVSHRESTMNIADQVYHFEKTRES